MKRFFLSLFAVLCLCGTLQAQSALQTLAASMQPGQWGTLATINESVLLNPGSSGAGTIIPYAMTAAYDSVRKQVHFIGGDHAGGVDPATGWNHVRYDLATNTWTRLGHPTWYDAPVPPGSYNDAHGYDLTAINPAGRKLYRLPYNSNIVHVFNLDADDTTNPANWSTLMMMPDPASVIESIEFLPERNSLIVFANGSGQGLEYSETTQAWTGWSYTPNLVSTWNWTVRDPVRHSILIGSSTGFLFTAVAPQMPLCPCPSMLTVIPETYRVYDGYGYNGLWTNDPATGNFLILTDPTNGTGRNLYEYDSVANTYTAKTSPPDKKLGGNFIAVPISDYGVTMWIWAVGPGGGSTGVYLYKNGTGGEPPPSSLNAFTTKCAQPGVLSCFGFDDQKELKYGYSTNQPACVNDPFIQPRYNISYVRGSEEGNTSAMEQNGKCIYPLVDTTKPHSGTGSLKFTIPSNSTDNTSGNFTLPFKGVGTTYAVTPGQSFWFQFYQYFDSAFLTTPYAPGGGWKQVILYGNPPFGSNSSGIESTIVNGYLRGVPQMYGQQGADDYGTQDVRGCYYNFNGLRTYTEPPCITYKANQWTEFTVQIDVGNISCYGGNPTRGNTRVRMWIDGSLAVDYLYACMNLAGTDGEGYGSFILTPFQTGKDPSQITPTAYTWYDDVIISTQPIAMGSADVPVPVPPIPPVPPDPPVNQPPTVKIVQPVNATVITAKTYTISVSGTDDVGVTWLELFINGQSVKSGAASAFTYSWNTSPYKGKTVNIEARAKDAEGLTTSAKVTVAVKK